MKFKEFFTEAKVQFILPPKMKNNFEIVGDLKNTDKWKAKTILGNNDEKMVGKMDEVGYVAVSPTSNIVVPIARADEHQAGYELINHLIKKKLIPDEDWITVFWSTNFIYGGQDKKYIENHIQAYKKWLELGGKDATVKGSNGIKYTGHFSDFIKRVKSIKIDGDVELVGGILPKGQALIKELTELSLQYKQLVDNYDKISHGIEKQRNRFIKRTSQLLSDLRGFDIPYPMRLFDSTYIEQWNKQILLAEDKNDIRLAGNILFGMNGIKNIIHRSLKALLEKKKPPKGAWYDQEYLEEGFGDIKLAKEEFDKMGQI